MNIYVYVKDTEKMVSFDDAIKNIKGGSDNLYISTENKRSFREFEKIKRVSKESDVIVVGSLISLGGNPTEIANQISWFIEQGRMLVICSYQSTYEFGVFQPMNKAVLTTILQNILAENKDIYEIPQRKRSNAGRKKVTFPDGWDELYVKWEKKEITAKEFICEAGLKKATFYNLLTEYKALKEINDRYVQKYKSV